MGAAPRIGDDAVSSRPYAGNSEYPTVLIHVTSVFYGLCVGSDNPFGADNQQERPQRKLEESSETIRRAQRVNAEMR